MPFNKRRTVVLGDLVATAFDEVSTVSDDAKRVARLATEVVTHVLCETGNVRTARRLARG